MTFEARELAAGPHRFNARAAGPPDGRLVLLLHGFPESAAQWGHQLGALAGAGHRAVAFDQRGYSPGARPGAVDDYAVGCLADDVLAVADALGGGPFDLVGHDWGAVVAWHVAASHPARVRTLTAVSVPHPAAFATALLSDPDQVRRSSYVEVFRQVGVAESFLLADDAAGLRAVFTASGLAATATGAVDEHVALLSEPGALTAALNWYRAASFADLAGLGPAGVPTLFVWSDADVAVGATAAEGCAAHVTGPYRFEVLPGVSHWIPEEAPEVLSALLLDHLAAFPRTQPAETAG